MTDPDMAERTYVEPITREVVAQASSRKERPDALLPTAGQTGSQHCHGPVTGMGVLEEIHGVEIGANGGSHRQGRGPANRFKVAMLRIGLDPPRSGSLTTLPDALCALEVGRLGLPMTRPSLRRMGVPAAASPTIAKSLRASSRAASMPQPDAAKCLIEESVIGWKEFEMEVMRDVADNVVIVCSIENFDPMGVHTGDSITVAPTRPSPTRNTSGCATATIAIMREIGVETGGSNVQFAIDPRTGRMVVIEMNPRVSRSSRSGVEGHRLSHRQNRRKTGGGDTGWTRFPTTLPAKRWPVSNPRLIMSSPRSRWTSRSFRKPIRC